MQHELDFDDIEAFDEIMDGEQYIRIWCITHQEYEWHWVALAELA